MNRKTRLFVLITVISVLLANQLSLWANAADSYFAPYIAGDADEDGEITNTDILMILDCIKDGKITVSSTTRTMDADCNNKIDNNDVLYILQHIYDPEQNHLHTVVYDQGYAATKTEKGKTSGSHCSVCNEPIVPQMDIPKISDNDPMPYDPIY